MVEECKSVLLVDDVNVFLQLECMFLQRKGFKIFTARNGREALRIARQERPDIILLDLILPDISGVECCKQIKSDPDLKSIPIIIVTTSGGEEDRARCIEAGCDGYLTKPIKQMELLERVQKALNFRIRAEKRLPISTPVRYTTEEGSEERGITLNISQGGMFVVTQHPPSSGTKITLDFQLKGIAQPFHLSGEAVWNTQGMPKGAITPGFGLRFTDIPDAKRAELGIYVEKHSD
jgi:uncharacterized protein (TIGR02266 family)